MRDAYDCFLDEEHRLEKLLEKLPKCGLCGKRIQQEDAVKIGHTHYCDRCLDDSREEVGGVA